MSMSMCTKPQQTADMNASYYLEPRRPVMVLDVVVAEQLPPRRHSRSRHRRRDHPEPAKCTELLSITHAGKQDQGTG